LIKNAAISNGLTISSLPLQAKYSPVVQKIKDRL